MEKTFWNAVKGRRTIYALGNEKIVSANNDLLLFNFRNCFGKQSSPKSCVKLSAQYLMVLHLDIISRSIFPLFRLIYQ